MKRNGLTEIGYFCFLIIFLSASHVGAQSGRFQELVNAAKKEASSGALVIYASNPREEKTRQALFDAFKKKYGLPDFKFEWLELHPSVAVPRTITERGLFSTKRSKTLPSMMTSSRECVEKVSSVTSGEREHHLNRAGPRP